MHEKHMAVENVLVLASWINLHHLIKYEPRCTDIDKIIGSESYESMDIL